MQTDPQSLHGNIKLKALSPTVNSNAYNYEFISLNTVEPSLGVPTSVSNLNSLSAYFFPALAIAGKYGDSRKLTGYNDLFLKNNILFVNQLSTLSLSSVNDSYFGQKVTVGNDLNIYGHVSAAGSITYANTFYTLTTAVSVYSNGPGPALYVFKTNGPYNIASFFAGNGVEALNISNSNLFQNSRVGINNSTPNVELTVNGQISANNTIFDLYGNSNEWNSAYTTLCANSAYWNSILPYVNSNFSKLSTQAFTLVDVTSSINTVRGYNISDGKYSAVLGGHNNNINGNDNTFILGSNITAGNPNFTYVNNLSSNQTIYTYRGTSDGWNSVVSTVCANSATWATSNSNYLNTIYLKLSAAPYNLVYPSSSVNPVFGGNITDGTYSFVAGGSANYTNTYGNVFILGSNLTANQAGFTYVNNLSSQGLVYDLSGNSSQWNSVYSTVCANSASWNTAPIYNYINSNFSKLSTQAFIVNNSTSTILPVRGNNYGNGNYSFIAGGTNNLSNVYNTFVLGSGITATKAGFTYVQNISSQGIVITSTGDSNQWTSTYSTVCANSAIWGLGPTTYQKLSAAPYNLVYPSSSVNPVFGGNTTDGTYSFIAGGSANYTNTYGNVFILGSNLTANQAGFTYVNNLSSQGAIYAKYYGDGTNLKLNINSSPYKYGYDISILPLSGFNNADADYSFIAGGVYNSTNGNANTFILGSNLTASQAGFTYVNAISSQGLIKTPTGNSDQWTSVYTTVCSNSAGWSNSNSVFTTVCANSANWNSVYSTVCAFSATWGSNYAPLSSQPYTLHYPNSSVLPIFGGNISNGTFSFVAGGSSNNINGLGNTFILGSNITAWYPNYTYVNNLSSQGDIRAGKFYGDGSGLSLNINSSPYQYGTGISIIPILGNSNYANSNNSFIAGGNLNNTNNKDNVFILGSSLTANQAGFTYVNNLSSEYNIIAGGYVAGSTPTNPQTSNYNFALSDNGGVVPINSSTLVTATVNSGINFPQGYQVTVIQTGSGQINVIGSGVTINQANGQTKTRTTWSAATLFYTGAVWVLFGDLTS